MSLEKISAAQVDSVMIKAAHALRGQQAEISRLTNEIAVRDRRDHAEKIAHTAVDRGIMEVDDADDYAEKLASGSEDLSMVEDFLGRTAAGVSLGSPQEKLASDSEGGSDVLTAFLLTSELAG
tara:strand:- start:394 stop:762 length:369 start_codon:yes stop_codon:yes gene_type:complete